MQGFCLMDWPVGANHHHLCVHCVWTDSVCVLPVFAFRIFIIIFYFLKNTKQHSHPAGSPGGDDCADAPHSHCCTFLLRPLVCCSSLWPLHPVSASPPPPSLSLNVPPYFLVWEQAALSIVVCCMLALTSSLAPSAGKAKAAALSALLFCYRSVNSAPLPSLLLNAWSYCF